MLACQLWGHGFNPRKTRGRNFLWKRASKTLKLLEFLDFILCFFIGMDLRDFFARNLLGENGYFIRFWHFRPNFELVLHTSKWLLCPQKVWKLFIYILVSIQPEMQKRTNGTNAASVKKSQLCFIYKGACRMSSKFGRKCQNLIK